MDVYDEFLIAAHAPYGTGNDFQNKKKEI